MYDDLIYVVDGVVYYCVVNMLGVYVCIFVFVLNNVIFFFVIVIVNKGVEKVFNDDVNLV